MLKLHHPDGWSVASKHHSTFWGKRRSLDLPCFKAPLGIGSDDQPLLMENRVSKPQINVPHCLISNPEDLTSQPHNRANPGTVSHGGVDLWTVLLLEASLPRPSGERWGAEDKVLCVYTGANRRPLPQPSTGPHTTWLFTVEWKTQPDSSRPHPLDRRVVSTARTITPLACSQILGLSFFINSSCFSYKKLEKFKLLIRKVIPLLLAKHLRTY